MNPIPISPREAALIILFKVEKEGAYANLETPKLLGEHKFSPQDSGLITQLVYGVLRHRAVLDYYLGKLLTKPQSDLPLWISLILRISLYQLIYLDRIPPSAAVNEGVKLAKSYGHQGTASLVNGVLRSFLRRREEFVLPRRDTAPEDYLTISLSHPRWLARYLLGQWSFDEVERFFIYNNAYNSFTLRVNTLKISRNDLLEKLEEEGYQASPGTLAPESIVLGRPGNIFKGPLFAKGYFQVQDESSMLASHGLNPLPGSRVIDLCAAPGGKTTHIAQLMGDNGEIKAFDIHPHKIKLIEDNCRRLGVSSVKASVADGIDLPQEYRNWADYLLLDAPCSGLGVLGARPDARWKKKNKDIMDMAELSQKLLNAAVNYLKPGGILLFSTCTVTREENIEAIKQFLSSHSDFRLTPLETLYPLAQDKADKDQMEAGFWQILPQKHNIDGFFMARLEKLK